MGTLNGLKLHVGNHTDVGFFLSFSFLPAIQSQVPNIDGIHTGKTDEIVSHHRYLVSIVDTDSTAATIYWILTASLPEL